MTQRINFVSQSWQLCLWITSGTQTLLTTFATLALIISLIYPGLWQSLWFGPLLPVYLTYLVHHPAHDNVSTIIAGVFGLLFTTISQVPRIVSATQWSVNGESVKERIHDTWIHLERDLKANNSLENLFINTNSYMFNFSTEQLQIK